MTNSYIFNQIKESIAVKAAMLGDEKLILKVEVLAKECVKSLQSGGKIIFAGNGGSFADAQHLSAEFISRFMFDRKPLASLALGTNNSAISAIGNDYGFDKVFSRELEGVGNLGDIFIPISTSGNSSNIVEAIKFAKQRGLLTVCFTGQSGGEVNNLCECISVPSKSTARIQESHILIGHILCGLVENIFFAEVKATTRG